MKQEYIRFSKIISAYENGDNVDFSNFSTKRLNQIQILIVNTTNPYHPHFLKYEDHTNYINLYNDIKKELIVREREEKLEKLLK